MSCCGKRRETWRGESPQVPRAQAGHPGVVYFRYVGGSAITVVGPMTGRVYRFWGAGAAAAADPRDAPAMAAVPHLMQISHP